MKIFSASILFFTAFFYSTIAFGQTRVDPAEISSTVPELTEFHDIIYPMWHNAYPSKDINALKGFIPKIKLYMESLNKAKLPGILRERQTEWESRLKELNKSAQDYYSAADTGDGTALLTATENLHSGYERMMRVIRPALKEIDDFHQTLYIVYHKLLPDSRYDEIAGMSGTLISRAEAISNYPQDKLKARMGDKAARFEASSKKLYNSTLSLKEALAGNNQELKKKAVESVHIAYVELDSIFK